MKKPLQNRQLLLFIMKNSFLQFLLAIVFAGVSYAHEAKAQELLNQNVSLKVEDTEVKTVLAKLENLANVQFVYSPNAIQANKKITLYVSNQRLSDVLELMLKPIKVSYAVVGGQILLAPEAASVISPKPISPNVEPAEQPISGTVKDKKGEPVIGVSILLKGTNKGTTTDVNGSYKLAANTGDVLVFSAVGYATQEVKVTGEKLDVSMNDSDTILGEVAVVGSRSTAVRTNVERPVPVDILSAKELQSTGQTELGQQVQFMSPSFNSSKNGINGIAGYADPASLKGLSPDQMLVLVNGKRRHQFSAVQNNVTVGKGTVITDLNAIPSLALDRLEILRDGAAAQYGSDAIAGIANLVLKKSINTGTAQVQYGVTSKGDGGGYTVGVNYGFGLGKGVSLNITGNYQDVGGTDRSDPYNPEPVAGGAYAGIYAAASATATAAAKATAKATDIALLKSRGYWGDGTYGSFRISKYGSNAMKSGQIFYNLDAPLGGDWTLYSFGGYSRKDIIAGAFLRTAIASAATSNTDVYPDGYNPSLPATVLDYSFLVGIKRTTKTNWNWDFSSGYGFNYIDQNANNSTNASLGASSPKNFYAGRTAFGQSVSEFNLSKTIQNFGGTKSFSLAMGGQFRSDNFTLTQGDEASYAIGPLSASKNKTPGSQGRVGIDIADVIAGGVSRTNLGLYVDAESDITNSLLVATALRYENYSDFGSNISGKIATRIKLNESFSLRGSINKGFRAPVLQQIANAASTSTVQSGLITATKQLPSSDARLAKVGIEDPKPENSWNYNLGVTAQLGRNFLFTLDAYQIDITDRIAITENLKVASITALKNLFAGFNEVTFFTNSINTQTQGIDLVASYKQNFGKNKLTASVAFTINKTQIVGVKPTPAALQLDTKAAVVLVDTITRALVETSQPHSKVLVSLGYQTGKFNINLRSTYFGEVTAWEKLTTPNPGTSNFHQAQTFSGKNLIDVSVGYAISKSMSLTVGGNNIMDVYPDKIYINYASYTNGQVPYSRNVNQFGFNGAYYYGTLKVDF